MSYHYNNAQKPNIKVYPIALGMVLIAVVSSGIYITMHGVSAARQSAAASRLAYKKQLLAEVDTAAGEPRSGRDPANQLQTSLASVAALPAGAGQIADTVAKDVPMDEHHHVMPTDVLPDVKKTGMTAGGCLIDYGIGGEQCVPASVKNNPQQACDVIKKLFPKGVVSKGSDPLHLNKNADTLACGFGD